MKPSLLLIFILAGLYPRFLSAQAVSFCMDVKETGEMVNPSKSFIITKNGGTIKMLVNLEHKANAKKIIYKVYRVSDQGDQYLDQTITDEVQPDWMWFYHDLLIRSPGNYAVFVYIEGTTTLLASGLVKILAAKK